MTPQEILELVRAGYSKAEIDAMTAPAPVVDSKSEPEPAPAADPKSEPEPAPAADPKPAPDSEQHWQRIESAIAGLVSVIQAGNISNAGIKTPPALKAEDALASLIKGGKNGK